MLRTESLAAWWRAARPHRLPLSPLTSLMLRSTTEWTSSSRCLLSLFIRSPFSSASPSRAASSIESHLLWSKDNLMHSSEATYECHSKHSTGKYFNYKTIVTTYLYSPQIYSILASRFIPSQSLIPKGIVGIVRKQKQSQTYTKICVILSTL